MLPKITCFALILAHVDPFRPILTPSAVRIDVAGLCSDTEPWKLIAGIPCNCVLLYISQDRREMMIIPANLSEFEHISADYCRFCPPVTLSAVRIAVDGLGDY